MAERWALFLHDTPELEFLKAQIARFGEPVLDLACGAGRLLLPLLRAGHEVEGSDVSPDMLDHAQAVINREGLQAKLHLQPMNELNLTQKYQTMYLIDSFGLAGSRQKDADTLARCCEHLHPDGALIVNIQAEYNLTDAWMKWTPEQRTMLPELWPEEAQPRVAEDGSQHYAYFRLTALSPLEQTYTRQVRLEKWTSGSLVASEQYNLTGNMYLKNELALMLTAAGFRTVEVYGDYEAARASDESDEIVFVAVK